jgi:hypothetical protein
MFLEKQIPKQDPLPNLQDIIHLPSAHMEILH